MKSSLACALIPLAMCLTACEASDFRSIGVASAPSASALVNGSLVVLPGIAGVSFTTFDCSTVTRVVVPLDVVLTAAQTVTVDRVTIRLLDGTDVGSMVTFPFADLTSQFGTTAVAAGTTRTFFFNPVFACAARAPQVVAADIVFVASAGHTTRITITSALR